MTTVNSQLEKGIKADSWGQVIEAESSFKSVLGILRTFRPISSEQADFIRRLSATITARIAQMRAPVSPRMALTVADLQKCLDCWEAGNFVDFPIDPVKYSSSMASSGISIRVDSWGLKDPELYIDPVCVVSLVTKSGNILDSRVTDASRHPRKPTAVIFEETVLFSNQSLESLETGISVFFEFKHWKPQKKKMSTRCWTFIDLADLGGKYAGQNVSLEIYHKPTDLKRKKLKLHSVKELFLQCSLLNSS